MPPNVWGIGVAKCNTQKPAPMTIHIFHCCSVPPEEPSGGGEGSRGAGGDQGVEGEADGDVEKEG